MDALHRYLKSERGRAVALAGAMGISPSAVSQWDQVPAERVLDVEQYTGVPRHELRPDLYPAPSHQEVA